MQVSLIDKMSDDILVLECDSVDINDGWIDITRGSMHSAYALERYEPLMCTSDNQQEEHMNWPDKIKKKWAELTAPSPDDALMEDVIKYLCDTLCLIEAITDDDTREEYLRYILKHARKWHDDEIDMIISLAR